METKPWLNEDGSRMTDEEIKVSSKNWSTSTWEDYLGKTFKYQLREDYAADHKDSDISSEQYKRLYVDKIAKPGEFRHLAARLKRIMRDLTDIQKEVIFEMFWNNKSYRQIAKERKVSKSTVQHHVNHALKNLRKGMLEVHELNSQREKRSPNKWLDFEPYGSRNSMKSGS